MNKLLEEAMETNPNYARTVRILRATTIVLVVVVLGALWVAISAVVENGAQDTNITNVTKRTTKIEKSACAKDQYSQECAELRTAIAVAEPIINDCIYYQRATGRRGANCPAFYVPIDGHALSQAQAEANPPTAPSSTPSPATNQGDGASGDVTPQPTMKPPHVGGKGGQPATEVPSTGGGSTGSIPPESSPQHEATGSTETESSSSSTSTSEEVKPSPTFLTPALEAVAGETGQAVGETVDPVVCGVAAALCHQHTP